MRGPADDTKLEIQPSGSKRGTPALHLDKPNWIIDRFIELIVDFLSQFGLFLDSTQPQHLKNPKQRNIK